MFDPSVGIATAEREISSSVPTVIGTAPAMTRLYDRWDDIEPFWGGSAITTYGGKVCSTGFAVTKGGVERLTTADHCGRGDPWFTFDGGTFVGEMTTGNSTRDVGLLRYRNYSPFIFVDGYRSNVGDNVVASHYASRGEWLCQGGALSGEICRNVVSEVNIYVDNGTVGPGYRASNRDEQAAAGQGDSGGPSYGYDSYKGGVDATGTITGGWIVRTCQGWRGQYSDRICYRDIFAVNIRSTLSTLSASLLTA